MIDQNGEQVGVISLQEALQLADDAGLDLVEVVSTSNPPVCKVINYGKFRYDQTKREKESKKSQHTIKVKEVKLKPNIDPHDLDTKMRQMKEFLSKGNKVKMTLMYRGREMMHPEFGEKLVRKVCQDLEEVATVEAPPKLLGRSLSCVLAPGGKKKKVEKKPLGKEETKEIKEI